MFKLNTIKSNWIISLSSGNQKQRSLKFHHLNQTMESVGNWLFNLFSPRNPLTAREGHEPTAEVVTSQK